jgi:hypothetical protein
MDSWVFFILFYCNWQTEHSVPLVSICVCPKTYIGHSIWNQPTHFGWPSLILLKFGTRADTTPGSKWDFFQIFRPNTLPSAHRSTFYLITFYLIKIQGCKWFHFKGNEIVRRYHYQKCRFYACVTLLKVVTCVKGQRSIAKIPHF